MSLTINQYSSWALQNAGNEVALNAGQDPGLDRASNQVNVFARFFGTSAAKATRTAVMTDFTRALTSSFGATLAQHVLADAGLTPSSKLTGQKIRAVIERANNLYADALSQAASSDLKLVSGSITQATIGGLEPMAKTHVQNYSKLRMVAIDTLGEMPLDADSLADFRARVATLRETLGAYSSLQLPDSAAEISNDAAALSTALEDKLNQASSLLAGKPLSDRNVTHYKEIWSDATLGALITLADKAEAGSSMETTLRGVESRIRANLRTGNQDDLLEKIPLAKGGQKDIAKLILDMVKELSPDDARRLSKDALEKEILRSYHQTLNEQEWPVIDKTFTASVGTIPIKIQSVIVPGAQIGKGPNAEKGPIGETYDEGVNGYMCHTADTSHAVNLAVTSLSVEDAHGQPQLAFQGIRHGVHCAWEITDTAERKAANVSRAQESVIAAFLANPANLQKVAHDAQTSGNVDTNGLPMATFDIRMTSISLLTPDSTRHTFQGGSESDERQMLLEQKAAWDEVSENGVQFTFQQDGRSYHVHIQPTVTTFNLGVNAGAVKWSSIAPNKAGGWDASDSLNGSAFRAITQDYNTFISTHAGPKAEAATRLWEQCRDILAAKGERKDNHDAYKLAARLAVLSNLIGGTPCWNCKSGKDRTGEMDVECKFLATLIARGEPIPEPGAKLTPEQTALFKTIALEGGNFEMQKLNTGVAGFKTDGVASIPERLGGKDVRLFHKGGAGFVDV